MTQGYNKISKMIADNVELATEKFSEVKTVNDYYEKSLRLWFERQQTEYSDEHLEKIYFECREVFQEVKDTSIHVIRTVLNKQLILLNPIIDSMAP